MRNHLKTLLILSCAVIIVGASGQLFADDNHAFPIFRMGVGARALGMGGAYSAVADDATAGYWNPAGLTGIGNLNLTSMISANVSYDRQYNYIAIGRNFGTAGWAAFSWVNAGVSNISGRDPSGDPTADFSYNQHGFYFSYANTLNDFSVGVTAKVAYQKSSDASSFSESGIGFDAGIKYAVADNVYLAFVATDLGTKIGRDAVPANFRIGLAAMAFEGFTFASDIEKTQHRSNIKVRLGAEYDYEFAPDYFGAIRAGSSDGDFTVGAGLTVAGRYSIDYSYVTEKENFLGENHRVSLTITF